MACRNTTAPLGLAALGLAALGLASCAGSSSLARSPAPPTTSVPEQSLEGDLVGTWQSRGCVENVDDERLEATCLTLDLEPSRQYTLTAESDYLESESVGRWGVIAVDDASGQLHLENELIAPFALRGEELEYFGQPMVKVLSAATEPEHEPFVTSFATLDEIVGHTWYRLGGPLASTREPAELTLAANGTYSAAFDSGCETSGDVWGYREEASPKDSYTLTESVLWLVEGCAKSEARSVNVDLLDGRVFLNGSAFGLEDDEDTNHALGSPTNGVSVQATYASPTDAGERTVLHLRVINDRTDTIEVSSIDVNTMSLVANDDDGYSTSTRSPDMTNRIDRRIPPGGRSEFEADITMPDGAGAVVSVFVRFEANERDMTAGVGFNPLFASG